MFANLVVDVSYPGIASGVVVVVEEEEEALVEIATMDDAVFVF